MREVERRELRDFALVFGASTGMEDKKFFVASAARWARA
jgi:hypothetical protein